MTTYQRVPVQTEKIALKEIKKLGSIYTDTECRIPPCRLIGDIGFKNKSLTRDRSRDHGYDNWRKLAAFDELSKSLCQRPWVVLANYEWQVDAGFLYRAASAVHLDRIEAEIKEIKCLGRIVNKGALLNARLTKIIRDI